MLLFYSGVVTLHPPVQALLEMGDLSMAQAMYNYYSERPPQIRGRTVYVQYSNHQQLKTEATSHVVSTTAEQTVAAQNLAKLSCVVTCS